MGEPGEENDNIDEIKQHRNGKVTSAFEAMWRELKYALYHCEPCVMDATIHEVGATTSSTGASEFVKYVFRPLELSLKYDRPMTMTEFHENYEVRTTPPACVVEYLRLHNLGSARSFIDELKNKNENLICVLASKDGDKSSLLVSSSKSIPKDVFSSNDLLQSLASLIGGKGGGKPDHAQAGGSQVKNFEEVFSEATKYIQNL